MKRLLMLLLFLLAFSAVSFGQCGPYGKIIIDPLTGQFDCTPNLMQGTIANLPAACTTGQIYVATDSVAGQNIYICTAADTWTAAGGTGTLTDVFCDTGLTCITAGSAVTVGPDYDYLMQKMTVSGISYPIAGAQQGDTIIDSSITPNAIYSCVSHDVTGCLIAVNVTRPNHVISATFLSSSALVSGTTISESLVYAEPLTFGCVVTAWTVTVDAGTVGFRVWRKSSGTAVPTVADTLNGGDLAIASNTNLVSTTMTNFTGAAAPTLVAGDILAFQLNAAATAKYAKVSLQCR